MNPHDDHESVGLLCDGGDEPGRIAVASWYARELSQHSLDPAALLVQSPTEPAAGYCAWFAERKAPSRM